MGDAVTVLSRVSPYVTLPVSLWRLAQELGVNRPASLLNLIEKLQPAPAPAAGLGSTSNYILYSDCESLLGVSVTINVTQDIVCESASGSTTGSNIIGFGFQLNAYSPVNAPTAWQQYAVAVWGNELMGCVDNWFPPIHTLDGAIPISIFSDFLKLTAVPSGTIPAGYQIKIALQNDSTGNVTGATYVITDNQGKTQAKEILTLTSISGVTSVDLAPIIAFELNLVGPVHSENAVLSSGAGTIVYAASSALTVLNQEPSCAQPGYTTAETANSFYGVLAAASRSNTLVQSFHVSSAV